MTRNILVAKLHMMIHRLAIEKQHWQRYQIIQTKLH